MRLENTWQGIWDHSSIQNLSRSFRFRGPRLWTLLFSSSHRFRSGDWNGHCKTLILWSVNHFCVDFEVCFGSLPCWKIQPQPSLSFLPQAVRFWFNICWYCYRPPSANSQYLDNICEMLNNVCDINREVYFLEDLIKLPTEEKYSNWNLCLQPGSGYRSTY